jgi:ribulose-bisphosphate carboxylase large chain
MGHPGGAAAGVASLKQGWEAAMQAVDRAVWPARYPELTVALQAFRK